MSPRPPQGAPALPFRGFIQAKSRGVNYLAKIFRLRHTEAMSFSSLRRWASRSTNSGINLAPNPTLPAGAEELFLKGLSFANGEVVAQDYAQAAACYAGAAEQGHSVAQLNLAALYERGQGVARDEGRARMWLAKAANLGNAAAQYRLGVQEHLVCGTGRAGSTGEGRIEALKWVRLSAAQGYHGAEGACEFVALGMTSEEVAEGGRRVAGFLPPTKHAV